MLDLLSIATFVVLTLSSFLLIRMCESLLNAE